MKNNTALIKSIKTAMTAAAMMAMSTGAAYAAGGSGATHLEGTVGGEAYSLLVDLSTLNLLKVKLGPVPYVSLPLEGGIVSETLLTVDLLNILNSGTLVNMTSGGVGAQKAGSVSSSEVENLSILGGLIKADAISTICTSYTDGTNAGSQANSTLVNLMIGKKKINLSTAPNTKIDLLDGLLKLGTIIINEQIKSGDGVESSGITANALHVKLNKGLLGLNIYGGDIVLSSASCNVNAKAVSEGPLPNSDGFITGGGGIESGSSIATFSFNAREGKGELQYRDRGTGMIVQGYTVDSFIVNGNCATFTGTAKVNGQDGFEYTATGCDNKEPGQGYDTFSIDVDDYHNDGTLRDGNIQLHPEG
jgi:hypothetical protein